MIGINLDFKNKPEGDGTLSNFTINDCLISQSGAPKSDKPQVLVHLPKTDARKVDGAWFEYDGYSYHVIGTTVKSIAANTPTRWNRYCIAERIY